MTSFRAELVFLKETADLSGYVCHFKAASQAEAEAIAERKAAALGRPAFAKSVTRWI